MCVCVCVRVFFFLNPHAIWFLNYVVSRRVSCVTLFALYSTFLVLIAFGSQFTSLHISRIYVLDECLEVLSLNFFIL